MAFWGTEVKPGKPYTHSVDRGRGRLRISQATLAIGSSTKKSLVQCNVGNKSPVLLCALLPDKTESLQLDLEFEEADDVVFSVIGPRGIYLTGYYVGNNGHSNLQDETESYGEDIGNSETEESNHCSDDDKYEDSFINDGEPEVLTFSPVSSDRVDEEGTDTKKRRNGKGNRKRLKKKYQSVESDDEMSSKQQNTRSGFKIFTDSDDEDNFIISSICKNMIPEGVKANTGTVQTGNKMKENDDNYAKTEAADAPAIDSNGKVDMQFIDDETKRKEDLLKNSVLPIDEVGPESGSKPKKKTKEASKKGETTDADTVKNSNALKEKAHQDEANANYISQDLLVSDKQDLEEPKKKRKETSKKGKITDTGTVNNSNLLKEKSHQDEANANNMSQDLLMSDKQDLEATTEKGSDITKFDPENDMKAKKKRREHSKKGKDREADGGNLVTLKEDEIHQAEAEANTIDQDVLVHKDEVGLEKSSKAKKKRKERAEVKADSMGKDLLAESEQDLKQTIDKSFDIGSDQLADGNQSEEKNATKKRRKKSKSEGIEENINMEVKEEKDISKMEFEGKNMVARSPEMRILSNGLIIEELVTGNSNGKVATTGRKVKVQYIAKLRENGHVIDSNIGKSPYKFRLGDKEVIEGLNVGLEGMRAGDKRRLIIPPSLRCIQWRGQKNFSSSGSQGIGENIPPNSCLVYDVELVGVH